MKVGDYVRTKYGIAKITTIDVMEKVAYTDNKDIVFGIEEQRCYEITQYAKPGSYVDSYYIPQDKVYISNYSPNIIDLIEIGDLVYVDISPDDCGGIIVPRITETENELNSLKLLIENKDYILKSIITHEQIESMKYKVKE